jgi:hypothetical protein
LSGKRKKSVSARRDNLTVRFIEVSDMARNAWGKTVVTIWQMLGIGLGVGEHDHASEGPGTWERQGWSTFLGL